MKVKIAVNILFVQNGISLFVYIPIILGNFTVKK